MTGLELEPVICAVLYTGMRISGLMLFAPFFGSTAVPPRVKLGLTVVLTALLYPVYGPSRLEASGAGGWLAIALSEAMIGLLLGLAVQLIFDAAQFAGQVMGIQMGFSLVNIIDPQTEVDNPILAIFYQLLTLWIFLQLDVHHWLLRGVARSFSYMPPGTLHFRVTDAVHWMAAASGIWLAGVQIAAPALVATLLADVTLGFLGKASPQLPVLFIGLSVKSVLGMVVLIAALPLLPRLLEKHFADAVGLSEQLLHLSR
jgi:flagellar biosynthesis protein FliR